MTPSLEEVLISVWRQAMVEGAKTVTVEGESFPVRRTSRSKLRKWSFNSKVTNCEGSSRIRKRILAGGNWRAKEKRLCSFSANAATLPLWWMKRCSSMRKRGSKNWNARYTGIEERTSHVTESS